jgi:acyl carrier protein
MSTLNAGSNPGKLSAESVIQLIAEALDNPATKLNEASRASDVPEWDSMGILSILSVLDREGVKCDIGNTEALQSAQGVLEIFRSAGRLG